MPPKKKKGKKGKKKGAESTTPGPEETGEPSEKEIMLQAELDQLTEELDTVKKRVEELRGENDWLQTEAQKVRVESHEYMSYMEKKTNRRQTTIVSLSDQNQKEIQDIRDQKDAMLAEYELKKQALRDILMEKENLLSKTRQELRDLHEYKELQAEQLDRIKGLEKEVMTMRGKHSEAIQYLKSQFLREKRQYQSDSDSKINSMAKQATKEAVSCLNDHTQKIKHENRSLRHELLLLIRKTRALHEHRNHLEEQQKELVLEQQYARDLKTLRSARQHKVLKSLGMIEDGKEDAAELS